MSLARELRTTFNLRRNGAHEREHHWRWRLICERSFEIAQKRRAITLARLFCRDDKAATAIEYGLIAALVSIIDHWRPSGDWRPGGRPLHLGSNTGCGSADTLLTFACGQRAATRSSNLRGGSIANVGLFFPDRFSGPVIAAALSDLFTMTIPNRITLLLVGGFAMAALVVGYPVEQVLSSLAGALDRPDSRVHRLCIRLGRRRGCETRGSSLPVARLAPRLRVPAAGDGWRRHVDDRPPVDAQHTPSRFRARMDLADALARSQGGRALRHSSRRGSSSDRIPTRRSGMLPSSTGPISARLRTVNHTLTNTCLNRGANARRL